MAFQQPMPGGGAQQASQVMPAQPADDAAPKLSHAEVRYGMAKPNGDKCATCRFFRGKDDCEIVAAPIYPAGWCEKFAASDKMVGAPQEETAERKPIVDPVMAHGRAIAGARALHAVGHITPKERDKHIGKSQAAIKTAPRKPFGSFSPGKY